MKNAADYSLPELFRMECESQCKVLTDGLLSLEKGGETAPLLEALMRAAHSLKGAARIVHYDQTVRAAHAMEDRFVAAQNGQALTRAEMDKLLAGVDLLAHIGVSACEKDDAFSGDIEAFLEALESPAATERATEEEPSPPPDSAGPEAERKATPGQEPGTRQQTVRIRSDSLDRLLGSAAESLMATRQLSRFSERLRASRRHHRQIIRRLEQAVTGNQAGLDLAGLARELRQMLDESDRRWLAHLADADLLERRAVPLARRLYDQTLALRMRPFADLATGLRRAVRDAAYHLGREVHVEIAGEATDVDRDLLERLESPLGHLIRNAVDHGIEPPGERRAAGKDATGTIRIEALHSSGFLVIRVADDGRGVDLDRLKKRIIDRGLATAETVAGLQEGELLDFLFLPGFSVKEQVSELSGRGVGLDVVQSLASTMRGTVRVTTEQGEGTLFSLQFPVSLSVMRVMHLEMGGESFAVPLARLEKVVHCPAARVESVEGRPFLTVDGQRIGLVHAAEAFGRTADLTPRETLPVIILQDDGRQRIGAVFDRFLGEGDVVIQPLDPRLGRVRNISAAALTEEGLPLLLIDMDDFLLSLKRCSHQAGRHAVVQQGGGDELPRRRILVVDDSLTVRELERKLITAMGYAVEIAVDGADGWNTVRGGAFDAVVTDVDMPRMDGIELTRLIKNDPRLRDIPVIMVTYKDREEDRRRGLEAGADYYLTKGSFQDEGLERAITDVLGETEAK